MSATEHRHPRAVEALLFIAPDCSYCPKALDVLGALIKNGRLARLEVINLALDSRKAQAMGVRSVPWMRVGPFYFEGLMGESELAQWIDRADTAQGLTFYVQIQLETGRLAPLTEWMQAHPQYLSAVLPLIEDADTSIHVRTGVGALIEEFATSAAMEALIPALGRLSEREDHRVRSDASHYLGLTRNAKALPFLEARRNDLHPEVREIAREALDALGATG